MRNHYFTGRDSFLEKLNACFTAGYLPDEAPLPSTTPQTSAQSNLTVISALNGLGGVGKTQLAIEFIYRQRNIYPYIFWLPAEEPNQLQIAYQKLAQLFQIDTQQPMDKIMTEIKVWFNKNPGCLLVYDNAPDFETIQDYLPLEGSHILVTSRSTDWHWQGKASSSMFLQRKRLRNIFNKYSAINWTWTKRIPSQNVWVTYPWL